MFPTWPVSSGVLRLGRTTRGNCQTPPSPAPQVFLKFFLEDKTSAPAVFISCLFIPRTHFEAGLVMVDYYGYEI